MRVFVTGATGFIGSRLIPELIQAGHQVLGLTRSAAGAERLAALGAQAHRGALDDLVSLRRGAAKADGVIHCAFDHDFSNYATNCENDRRVIEAIGTELAGSDRPLVITSAIGMGSPGHGEPAREEIFNLDHPNPRRASEFAGGALLQAGVNVSVMRLPQVHDTIRQGLVSPLIELARAKGAAAYVGDGLTRWSATHITDVARLYRLALEKAKPGGRYHAVDEEGVTARDIAEVIGQGLRVPVISIPPGEVQDHFGPLGIFADLDMRASGLWTQKRLDWKPRGPGLLEDLRAMDYGAI
ncbi:SDR family oxidoreductase [Roseomonas haemaphysalidis]|uniref:SDR family oxidoreductase n=1 Tax=Roseomonas haemaphysalidis TaxID=2768162 RepID=A0ABS3KVV4_9PROT|nr:SDR family oxidoreductase [Roseomonas haemaphysalidis]MBO1081608.1 SDR family oxidoreductase [Roseomonas haemaphysalidis]